MAIIEIERVGAPPIRIADVKDFMVDGIRVAAEALVGLGDNPRQLMSIRRTGDVLTFRVVRYMDREEMEKIWEEG